MVLSSEIFNLISKIKNTFWVKARIKRLALKNVS